MLIFENCASDSFYYFFSGSLFDRYEKISGTLREIYTKEKSCDVRLKAKRSIIRAHQFFLATRSPVFHAMFCDATKRTEEGFLLIEDVDFNTMDNLLLLMYSGDMNKLTRDKALPLYAAAEKFDIKDVKEMLSEFIVRNLSVEWVLDVIKETKSHQDETIGLRCREYFKENAHEILQTDNWKRFAEENPGLSVDLLSTTVKLLSTK